MNMIKIGLAGVTGVLLALQFKGGKTEYGLYISLAVSTFIFLCITEKLSVFVKSARRISDFIEIDAAYLGAMLKMAGVTYVAEFTSGVCKDAGYHAIATQIEIFGKLVILMLGMPVLSALLETIREFLR